MLVFTDKEQDTPAVEVVAALTYVNFVDQALAGKIASLGESRDGGTSFPGSFDHDTNPATPAIEGTFTCPDESCSLVYTGSGDDVDVTIATGYTFSGSREAVTAVEANLKKDYLLFGVWLDEAGALTDEMRAPIPSGPSQRVDSRSPRPAWELSKVKRRIAVPQSGPIIRRVAGCRLSMATPL